MKSDMMTRTISAFLLAAALTGCVTPRSNKIAEAAPICAPRPSSKLPPYPISVPIDGVYDANNPFARILRGEIPAVKVFEDDHVLAFMDQAPVEQGHVLIVSKISHARNQLDVDPVELDRMFAVARLVGRAQMAGLGADGFQIEQNNGYGQTVAQLHIHVIPRYHAGCWLNGSGPKLTIEQREAVAVKIREALARQ